MLMNNAFSKVKEIHFTGTGDVINKTEAFYLRRKLRRETSSKLLLNIKLFDSHSGRTLARGTILFYAYTWQNKQVLSVTHILIT